MLELRDRLRLLFLVPGHRRIPALLLLLWTAALLPTARAQTEKFPASTVTIVVPFAPGGASDVTARTLGQALSRIWKVPVVVENKVGAAGKIAADSVARATADGYTLLMGAASIVTNPALHKTAPYIPHALTPLGVGVTSQLVTIVRSDLPANEVAGVVALSTRKPEGLNAASPGTGTLSHLGLEMLVLNHRAKLNHVPYRGSGPALTDVMGGQADIMIDAITSAAPAIASAKVKAIAVHTARRTSLLPDVPTYEEQGVKNMTFGAWNIFVVPSATPADRIAALHAALAQAIKDPDVAKTLADRGLDAITQTPKESLDFMRSEAQRWEKVIRDAKVSP